MSSEKENPTPAPNVGNTTQLVDASGDQSVAAGIIATRDKQIEELKKLLARWYSRHKNDSPSIAKDTEKYL